MILTIYWFFIVKGCLSTVSQGLCNATLMHVHEYSMFLVYYSLTFKSFTIAVILKD